MARPSIKKQRTEEILNAFAQCLTKYGLAGSTLERLAQESGLQRSLIRHYVGNRENLIRLLADKVLQDYQRMTDELFLVVQDIPNPPQRLEYFLDILFDPQYQSSTEHALILEALINASANGFPELKQPITAWIDSFVNRLSEELEGAYPQVTTNQCHAVSFGIISIYFNLDALSPLGLSGQYHSQAQHSAKLLLNTLAL